MLLSLDVGRMERHHRFQSEGRRNWCLMLVLKAVGPGTPLVAQWLRLQAPSSGSPGSIPGQATGSRMPQLKIPDAATKTQGNQINEYKLKKKINKGRGARRRGEGLEEESSREEKSKLDREKEKEGVRPRQRRTQ